MVYWKKAASTATSAPAMRLEASGVEGRVLISASGANEYAQESDALQGSYFTHYLVTGLRGAADTSRDTRETDMTSRAMGDAKFTQAVLPRIPVRRWGTIDDFGGLAVFLMSDASAYMTGEQLVVDGGYSKF